jgi:hypothetical protein
MDEWMDRWIQVLSFVSVGISSALLAIQIMESVKGEMLVKNSGVCWNKRN